MIDLSNDCRYLGADFLLSDFQPDAWDLRLVAMIIPLCLVARACSIFPLSALINCRRNGKAEAPIGWKSQLVLWFAGLRGAIAYGLAKRWDAEPVSPPNEVTTVMAVVIFTTFVLGSTVASLIRCLGLEGTPDRDEQAAAADKPIKPAASVDDSIEASRGGNAGLGGGLLGAEAASALSEEGLDERTITGQRKRSVPTMPRMAPRKSDIGMMSWFRNLDATGKQSIAAATLLAKALKLMDLVLNMMGFAVVTPMLGGKRALPPTNEPCCGLFARKRRRTSVTGNQAISGLGGSE